MMIAVAAAAVLGAATFEVDWSIIDGATAASAAAAAAALRRALFCEAAAKPSAFQHQEDAGVDRQRKDEQRPAAAIAQTYDDVSIRIVLQAFNSFVCRTVRFNVAPGNPSATGFADDLPSLSGKPLELPSVYHDEEWAADTLSR